MEVLKRVTITYIFILMLSGGTAVEAKCDVNPDPYQRILIVMLYPYIDEAIKDYYEDTIRGYDLYDAKVSNLESLYGWSKFNVTVEVNTFYGAHNPPHGIEIMTFYIALGEDPLLIEYEHKDIN